MRLALDAAAGQPEPTAWSLVELAKLGLGAGRPAVAARHVRAASRVFPGYPSARVELARSELALGRLGRRSPRRGARPCCSDVRFGGPPRRPIRRAGKRADAAPATRDRRRHRPSARANGVRVDLESAVYRADHGSGRWRRSRSRARHARTAVHLRRRRPGWALARAGRCDEALPFARARAAAGDEGSAPLFHRGYAEGCAGIPRGDARVVRTRARCSIRSSPSAGRLSRGPHSPESQPGTAGRSVRSARLARTALSGGSG